MHPHYFTQSKYYHTPNYQTIDTDDLHYSVNGTNQYQTIKSNQMLSNILDTIQQKAADPHDLKRSLSSFDKQFMQMYQSHQPTNNSFTEKKPQLKLQNNYTHQRRVPKQAVSKRHGQNSTNGPITQQSTLKLKLPKPNTLTDQFIKTILGPQQQQAIIYIYRLIEEYDRTINPKKYEQKLKQHLKVNAKQLFSQPQKNSPSLIMNIGASQFDKSKAFYDQQYYTYLKTNMKYLSELNASQNPQRNQHLANKFTDQIKNQFYSTQINQLLSGMNIVDNTIVTDSNKSQLVKQQLFMETSPEKIVQKLQETGGIQNTIQKMQKSLKKNQLQHTKLNQYIINNINIDNNNINKNKNNHNNQQYIINKPSLLQTHKEKRLTLNKSATAMQKILTNNSTQKLNYQTQQPSLTLQNQSKINFTPSSIKDHALKLNQQYQSALMKQRDNQHIQNPSILNMSYDKAFFQEERNWRDKSQSLRHKIQHSLERQ